LENLSLEVAYSRYGAQVSSRYRNLSSLAGDGSVVLSCFGGRFDRPQSGVMRYSAMISQESGSAKSLLALREHIEAAHAAGTIIRPVMITLGSAAIPRRVFVRPDLTGTVVSFDGDRFAVDFVRAEPVEQPKARRKR
jgi:hypothetical protein